MTNGQISEFLLLLDRKTAISSHSVADWRPEYSAELQEIERKLSVLRVVAGQESENSVADRESYVPTMVTITEAAKRTSLSSDYIRKLVKNNKIKYVRSGTKYLVNYERLVEYLEQGDTAESARKERAV